MGKAIDDLICMDYLCIYIVYKEDDIQTHKYKNKALHTHPTNAIYGLFWEEIKLFS